ncbi:hypothetical protein EG835_01080 [bacterium]|nr:hypothetical protein [bacterium]
MSEILVLVLALGLAPIFIWTLRRLNLRDKGFLGMALVAVFVAYVATVAEGYWLPDAFNTIEHALEPVVAISFALFATRFFRRRLLRQGGDHS